MPTVRYTTVNGEIIAEKRDGVRKLYMPDPLGSTAALLNSSQARTDTFSYWPYLRHDVARPIVTRSRSDVTCSPMSSTLRGQAAG